LILALLAVLVYLNQVGLPDFAKKRLLEELRLRGINLQFSRLRLRFYQGIVAENVRFGRAEDALGPHLSAEEVQVRMSIKALVRFQLQAEGLVLRQGRLVWPLAETNQPSRQLEIDNIQTDLHLMPGDQWALDNFQARFAGAQIRLSGTINHASSVRDWKLFQGRGSALAGAWQDRIRELADTLERIHFSATPELTLDLRGDARDLQSFSVRMTLSAPGAQTPWGTVSRGRFSVWVVPTGSNSLPRAELALEAASVQTRWATTTNLQLAVHLDLASSQGQTNLIRGDLVLRADQMATRWGGARNAHLTAQWVHALTNAVPLTGQGQFQCRQAQTPWGRAGAVQLAARFSTSDERAGKNAGLSDSPWKILEPYLADWECRVAGIQSPRLDAGEILCGGSWRAPALTISNLQAKLYGGEIDLRAALDAGTRALTASLSSDVDPHKLAPGLSEWARRWLGQFAWTEPPRLKADLAMILPAWTNRQPDWRSEVQPTLSLQGEFDLNHGAACRGVPVSTAHSHFSYSNSVWRLPDLTVTRPEGRLQAAHRADDRTGDYYWRISSTLDPAILRPLFDSNIDNPVDLFSFTQPPVIDVEVWGSFHDPGRLGLKGRVALTNFTFRGESATGFQTTLQFTNRVLELFSPRLQRGEQQISADGLAADFNAQVVHLTNGFSTAEPAVVARAIGPQIVGAIEPYHFLQPPTARVNGAIPLNGETDADLRFDVDGGPFHWWKLDVSHVVGHVHWQGQRLDLSDVRAEFYGGQAALAATFDFSPAQGADFQFSLETTNAVLRSLMADLSDRTNHLEGRLSGTLIVTKANTAEIRKLDGYGIVRLRDGLIWDIPLFGVFSPVLDGVVPGLGSSRASAGACTFTITNGLISSDDLEIRSPAMRLLYRGSSDLDGRVNARVEAELLRDMWLVGPVVSTVFRPVTKLFEYKVTGTLGEPKTEPVFLLPKLVLLPFQMPFHPFRTLKGLLPEDSDAGGTNAPPLNSPKAN